MVTSARRKTRQRPAPAVLIPEQDADGFFSIRFESIGGLGAHLAGQIMGEAGVLRQGLNGSHFSSYGSEKKGSPVTSYVRFCSPERDIRTSSPIEKPQVVAVFHEALAKTLDVTAGLGPTGTLIMNTRSTPDQVRRNLGLAAGTVGVVDALGISVEEGSRVNTAMLGAVTRVCRFIDPEAVRETIRGVLSRRYAHLVQANIRTFDRGYRELRLKTFRPVKGKEPAPTQQTGPAFGYLDAPMGGAVVDPGNTIVKDLTASRQGFIPVYDPGTCVHCGLCDIVCPDFCFVWEEEDEGGDQPTNRLQGIDYHYCKGCLKCTEVCPTTSLTEAREEVGYAEAHRVPLYPWLERRRSKDGAKPYRRGGRGG